MARRLFVLLCFTFLLTDLSAQRDRTKDQQKVLKKVSDRTCDCIEKSKTDTIRTEAGYTKIIQGCMMTPMMDNLDDLLDAFELKTFDAESGQVIGMEIGKYLVVNCPKFTEVTMRIKGGQINQEMTNELNTETGQTEGKLVRTETSDFVYFILKDPAGNESRFLWQEAFYGSDAYVNNPDVNNGKRVRIEWKEVQVYLPQARGYFKVKKVTAIQLLD